MRYAVLLITDLSSQICYFVQTTLVDTDPIRTSAGRIIAIDFAKDFLQ